MTQDLLDRCALAEELLARGEWSAAAASLEQVLALAPPRGAASARAGEGPRASGERSGVERPGMDRAGADRSGLDRSASEPGSGDRARIETAGVDRRGCENGGPEAGSTLCAPGQDAPESGALRSKLLVALVAARLQSGTHQDLVAAEAPAAELRDLYRKRAEKDRAPSELERRAGWISALETLRSGGGHAIPRELLAELEQVLDEPPSPPAAFAGLIEEAGRVLAVEEALSSSQEAAEAGEVERSDAFLSLALADSEELPAGPRAHAGLRAAELLVGRREAPRATSLLRSLLEQAERGADHGTYYEAARRLGDLLLRQGLSAEAWSVFDRARALAGALGAAESHLLFLRRLAASAARRGDPRALDRLEVEILRELERATPEAQREAAVTAWVLGSLHAHAGRPERARRLWSVCLVHAEAARDMPLAWLAAAQLGDPLPAELVRRLQRPPVEASDLLGAALEAKSEPGDPEFVLGLLEGAARLLPFEHGAPESLGRRIDSERAALAPPAR